MEAAGKDGDRALVEHERDGERAAQDACVMKAAVVELRLWKCVWRVRDAAHRQPKPQEEEPRLPLRTMLSIPPGNRAKIIDARDPL
jgi:hypothetical protein